MVPEQILVAAQLHARTTLRRVLGTQARAFLFEIPRPQRRLRIEGVQHLRLLSPHDDLKNGDKRDQRDVAHSIASESCHVTIYSAVPQPFQPTRKIPKLS